MMNREDLVFAGYSDIAGLVRGRGFPAKDLASRLAHGIGWTPTNINITAFRDIADSPFGQWGDVLLKPDPTTEVNVNFGDDMPREHFYLCDVLETDGSPWPCCPRNFLRQALDDLESEAGLRLYTAFEHELHYSGADATEGSSYSLAAFRGQGEFGEMLTYALEAAGIAPEGFLSEYGPRQYEVAVRPAMGVASADRAVILRELVRSAAHRLGHRASFSPIMSPDGLGNGVHIHISLRDLDGNPATYDESHRHGLSQAAGRFIAGILRHMPALCAMTAPTVVSYLRLAPHRWSASYNNLGYRDREAGVRIAPVNEISDTPVAAQYNFEYRAGDATASPYLALGAVVNAGPQGLREELPMPHVMDGVDAEELGEDEKRDLGIARLPTSLAGALDALDDDETARSWFPVPLLDAYLRYKRYEVEMMKDLSAEALCARYGEVY